jgi:hypothetical protein
MRTSFFAAAIACSVVAAPVTSQAQTTANTPPIGQAVSGNNSTAAGTSGTGLNTNGTANTGSMHGAAGRQAAGINRQGQVTGKSTAVINPAPGQADNVNAQATNTTAPAGTAPDAKATGGRGKAGTKAEQEVIKANSRAVKEVPGDRMKTEAAARASERKHAAEKRKGREKSRHPGATGQGLQGDSGS